MAATVFFQVRLFVNSNKPISMRFDRLTPTEDAFDAIMERAGVLKDRQFALNVSANRGGTFRVERGYGQWSFLARGVRLFVDTGSDAPFGLHFLGRVLDVGLQIFKGVTEFSLDQVVGTCYPTMAPMSCWKKLHPPCVYEACIGLDSARGGGMVSADSCYGARRLLAQVRHTMKTIDMAHPGAGVTVAPHQPDQAHGMETATDDILVMIFEMNFVSAATVARWASVCRRWRALLREVARVEVRFPNILWSSTVPLANPLVDMDMARAFDRATKDHRFRFECALSKPFVGECSTLLPRVCPRAVLVMRAKDLMFVSPELARAHIDRGGRIVVRGSLCFDRSSFVPIFPGMEPGFGLYSNVINALSGCSLLGLDRRVYSALDMDDSGTIESAFLQGTLEQIPATCSKRLEINIRPRALDSTRHAYVFSYPSYAVPPPQASVTLPTIKHLTVRALVEIHHIGKCSISLENLFNTIVLPRMKNVTRLTVLLDHDGCYDHRRRDQWKAYARKLVDNKGTSIKGKFSPNTIFKKLKQFRIRIVLPRGFLQPGEDHVLEVLNEKYQIKTS